VTVEEVMVLATGRYIDFPGVGIVDLDAPELPSNDREMLEVATEWMFTEPSILETTASVSRALHQYERAGGFAPPAASEAEEVVPEELKTDTESVAVVSAPLSSSVGQVASLPQPAEAAEPTAAAAVAGATEGVVGEAGHRRPARLPPALMRSLCRMSPPRPFTSALLPRTQQEPPPQRSKRLRRSRAQHSVGCGRR
jgi:hypothetical protein